VIVRSRISFAACNLEAGDDPREQMLHYENMKMTQRSGRWFYTQMRDVKNKNKNKNKNKDKACSEVML